MEKRTVLAFALVAIVWIAWLVFFPAPDQTQRQERKQQKQESAQKKVESKTTPPSQVSIGDTQTNKQEKTIEVSTNKYRVQLTTKGASIQGLNYKERNIDLVVTKSSFETSKALDFAIHFNDDEFIQNSDLNQSNWSYSREQDGGVRFYTTIFINDNPIRVEKIYRFNDNNYYFTVEYRLHNVGNHDVSFQNDSLIVSPGDMIGPNLDFHNTYNNLSSIFYLNGDFDRGGKGGGLFSSDDPIGHETGEVSWFGIMSRYFLLIMIPEGFTGSGVVYDRRENHGYRTGMYMGMNMLRAGTDISRSFRVYVGEKNKDRLAAIGENLIDAADISKWIEPIRYFVLWCLFTINGYIGNLGWSLVIFSLLTKIVFTPLTMKSMDSMKRMQQLTPKLNQIKEKYKDKPDVVQREMMKLYKENKVNPLGGCFPMLLQMPFFFALYSALINSIDLWDASFVLWIRDLSMPDTVATIAGFNLNILPLVMTATSFAQQKMSTVDTGPQQKMMMMMMPVVLLFVFWTMPSGLVLYWTLQNVFQIVHQLIINKMAKKKT